MILRDIRRTPVHCVSSWFYPTLRQLILKDVCSEERGRKSWLQSNQWTSGEYYLFGSLKTKISVHETSSTMIISVTDPSLTNSVIAVEDKPQTRHSITKFGEKLWVSLVIIPSEPPARIHPPFRGRCLIFNTLYSCHINNFFKCQRRT